MGNDAGLGKWDVLVLTRLEERGEAFFTTLPDQRPAGESADYQGKNNTRTIQSSRHQRERKGDGEIGRGGGQEESRGRGFTEKRRAERSESHS